VGAAVLLAAGGLAYVMLRETGDPAEDQAAGNGDEVDQLAGPVASSLVDEISAVVGALGGTDVRVEQRGSTIHLIGSVADAELRETIADAARSLAGTTPVDVSELTVASTADDAPPTDAPIGTGSALQAEIDRIIAATPIIFASGQTEISDLHQRVLNNVAAAMIDYPGIPVAVVGFTDDVGSDEVNRQLSLDRAESVRSYLIAKGVPENLLTIDAQGEATSSGSEQLANLERRVEFRVAAGAAPPTGEPLRVAMVAPSDQDDLAFSQSMADAVAVIAAERGNVEVDITDNTFVPDEAAAALRGYAEAGYDLIIAHGSQYGSLVLEIAPEYPDIAFAWGTASDTFDLANVYAYDAASEQGGYVMGAMSALLTETGTVGVVGPIEVGDAERYVNGFRAGALAEAPSTSVLVTYTGSFSDVSFARDAALAHVADGADVMTGSAQMVLGAVTVAIENDVLWFGTQANQAPLAPDLVVASQVYHWEVILRQIVADVDAGRSGGRSYTAELANGGLIIEFNPQVELADAARRRADDLITAIAAGDLAVEDEL
ncbi:MAG: BMP family ABC transporter substrate-binding protein, partial [Acidimicrobiales bacterium]